MVMLHFNYSSVINAPVEAVWRFHERPDILQILTPPWQPVQAIRREGGLKVGAVSEFILYLGPLPVRWVARHTEYEANRLFTDEQVSGPMQSWVHRHQFSPLGDKTRLTDAIAFSLPGDAIAETILNWWVQARLHDMFRYRHEVTKKACEQGTIY
jgi:ligand-binding SRPBCC domain-containing protein